MDSIHSSFVHKLFRMAVVGAIYPLHVGVVGGLGIKSLYIPLGLAPIALFITGFFLWWSRTYGVKAASKDVLTSRMK